MVYEFVKITQVGSGYGFDGVSFFPFFLLNLTFFIVYFFSYSFRENHIIKLYKITKIKGYGETTIHPHSLHCGLQ